MQGGNHPSVNSNELSKEDLDGTASLTAGGNNASLTKSHHNTKALEDEIQSLRSDLAAIENQLTTERAEFQDSNEHMKR